MPELPDLQVFSANLTKALSGKKVQAIKVVKSKKLNVPAKQLQTALVGKIVKAIVRDGKELHFIFNDGSVLALHLMLRGKLHWFEEKNHEKFTILEMMFAKGPGLAMSDYQGQATPTLNPEKRPGVDALSDKMNFKLLKDKLAKSKASIKNVLLDQKFIRGIGNAYADEILWDCGISPFSISKNIPEDKIKALVKSIRKVLTNAEKQIKKAHPELITGEIRDFLSVHNSKRESTPKGENIMVDTSGSRKTYYTKEQALF